MPHEDSFRDTHPAWWSAEALTHWGTVGPKHEQWLAVAPETTFRNQTAGFTNLTEEEMSDQIHTHVTSSLHTNQSECSMRSLRIHRLKKCPYTFRCHVCHCTYLLCIIIKQQLFIHHSMNRSKGNWSTTTLIQTISMCFQANTLSCCCSAAQMSGFEVRHVSNWTQHAIIGNVGLIAVFP